MSFPDGLTAAQKDAWFMTGANPSVWSQVILLSGVYQVTYRLSVARRFAGMTNFVTKNGTTVIAADISGLTGGGFWTSAGGATVIVPDWSSIVGGGTIYVDRHGVTPDSPKATKGEETMDLVWLGPIGNYDPMAIPNPVDSLPEPLTATIIEGKTASPAPYLLQSLIPENSRYFTPYQGTAGQWVNQNIFTMMLTRKFVGLTGFASIIDLAVKTTGVPVILSGVGVTTAIDFSDIVTGTDGFKRLYVTDEKISITDPITGEGEQVLTLGYASPLKFT